MLGVAALFMMIALVVGFSRAFRRARRASGWVRERRPATAEERSLVLLWPWSTAVDVFFAWVSATSAAAVTAAMLGYPPLSSIRIGVIGALAGCGAAGLSFLLLEELFRPVLRVALAGHAAPGGNKLGLRRRLILLWALSSAVPLSVLGTIWIGQPAQERLLLPVVLAVNSAVAVVWGLAGTYAVARSLIEPVTSLKAAQRKVQDGDLNVQIPVDYGGEVGELQAGFNHMVAGLLEHQRLHDIFGRHVGYRGGPCRARDGCAARWRAPSGQCPVFRPDRLDGDDPAAGARRRGGRPERRIRRRRRLCDQRGRVGEQVRGRRRVVCVRPAHRAHRARCRGITGGAGAANGVHCPGREPSWPRRRDRRFLGGGHRRQYRGGGPLRIHRDRRRGQRGRPPHRAGQKGTRTFARVTRCGRRGRRRDVLVASARADALAGPVIGHRNLRPTRRSASWGHLPLAGERKSTL